MASVSELRAIVQSWGQAFSKKYGTTCKWVDLYARNPAMGKYQQYKVTVTNRNIVFATNPPIEAPSITFKQVYDNNTSMEQIWSLTYHKSTTSTFTWSLTEGIDVGYQLSVTAPLPPGVFVGGQVSTNLSFSSTQEKQEQDEVSWDFEQQLTVPANTKNESSLIIVQQKYDVSFVADVVLTGYVAIWNASKIDVNNPGGSDRHWLWFIPIARVFREYPVQGYVVQGNAVVFKSHGVFKGVEGVNSFVRIDEYPSGPKVIAPSTEQDNALKPEAEYIIPVSGVQIRHAETPPLEAFSVTLSQQWG
jgi:hypothetical protein